jgi:hypothetical protein
MPSGLTATTRAKIANSRARTFWPGARERSSWAQDDMRRLGRMIHSWLRSSWRWRPYWRRSRCWRSPAHREGRKCPHRTPGGFGGSYLSIFGGGTGPWPRGYEELASGSCPARAVRPSPDADVPRAYKEIHVDLSVVAAAGLQVGEPRWLPAGDGTPEHPDMRTDSSAIDRSRP